MQREACVVMTWSVWKVRKKHYWKSSWWKHLNLRDLKKESANHRFRWDLCFYAIIFSHSIILERMQQNDICQECFVFQVWELKHWEESKMNEIKSKRFSQAQSTRRKQIKSNLLIWAAVLVRSLKKILTDEMCFENDKWSIQSE